MGDKENKNLYNLVGRRIERGCAKRKIKKQLANIAFVNQIINITNCIWKKILTAIWKFWERERYGEEEKKN